MTASPLLTLTLNSFIRYYAMDRSKLVGEIERRMQKSGGYDYYRMLTDAIRAFARGATEDEIQFILGRSGSPSEVSHNRAAYEVFLQKFGKKRNLAEFEKKGRVRLCDGQLVVTTAPIFTLEDSTGLSVFNVWATQKPNLDRARAGVGVFLMDQAFRKTAPNYNYKMFDAVEGKVFQAVNNSISKAVESCARSIVEMAREY